MTYPMRVELTVDDIVEIQPPGLSGHSWVMSKENALKLVQWIVELVQSEDNEIHNWQVVDQDAAHALNQAMDDAVTTLGAMAASPTLNARVKKRTRRALGRLLAAHDLLCEAIEWK